jgi:hypothetical protein
MKTIEIKLRYKKREEEETTKTEDTRGHQYPPSTVDDID